MRHFRQRGVALLVAITIFAIATTLAAAITYNKAMAARRAAATFTLEQALQAGMAAEALADLALENSGGSAKTTLDQDWAQPFPPTEIEGTGIWIAATVEDLAARFNLNSVVKWDAATGSFVADTDQIEIFQHLLSDLNIDVRYADFLVDWIDTDIAPYGQGGEDTLYLSQTPPYRPPNTFISHTSEILAFPGFGAENYAKIAPYIAALPNDVKFNTCTGIGLIIDLNRNDPQNQTEFANVDFSKQGSGAASQSCRVTKAVFSGVIADPARKAKADARADETSQWFRLRTNIRIGTAEFVLYSVLFREPDNTVRTIQRSFGSE
ncbi:MAG: type II secretion system minor pseudopilin GspK [Pseudomonadota bacterium]